MKSFTAFVVDKEGKKKTIIEEAISTHLLEESLFNRGFFVIRINEGKINTFSINDSKLSKKFILDFTYNIYSLLDFGIDINEASKILTDIYKSGKESEFVNNIYYQLKKGEKLSTVLKNNIDEFGDFYITMVNSGETSGKLTDSFKLLYVYLKNNQKTKDKIISASIYPVILLTLAFLATHFFLLVLLPNIEMLYKNMDFTPPLVVQFMINISNLLNQNLIIYLFLLLLFIIGIVLFFKTNYSKIFIQYVLEKLPILSKINKLHIKIKTSFSLEILLKGGSSIEDALKELIEIDNNPNTKKELKKCLDILKEGGGIKESFQNIKVFDSRDLSIIEISESISKTKEGFEKVRLDAESNLENYLDTIFKLIEPVMMILIGILVFFMMFFYFSPTLGILNKM